MKGKAASPSEAVDAGESVALMARKRSGKVKKDAAGAGGGPKPAGGGPPKRGRQKRDAAWLLKLGVEDE